MQCKQELVANKRLSNGDKSHIFVQQPCTIRGAGVHHRASFALARVHLGSPRRSAPHKTLHPTNVFHAIRVSDPLSLVPFALAARDGVIDGWPVRQLVAAGVSLLRGSAPLVRTLAGKRSAILLPSGPLVFTALAASDGRVAVLMDPAEQVASPLAGAYFTTDALQGHVPAGVPRVLLDEAPHRAHYVDGDRRSAIDLAMHPGLAIEGDPDAAGSTEAMLLAPGGAVRGDATSFTHRALLARARATIALAALGPTDHVLVLRDARDADALASGEVATLLAGGRVTTGDPRDVARALERIGQLGVTVIAARATVLEALLAHIEATDSPIDASSLRAMICVGDQLPDAATARWSAATGRPVSVIPAPDR